MTATPPGWYPDPYGGHQLRWWDGQQWSTWTAPMPAPEPDRSPWRWLPWVIVGVIVVVGFVVYVAWHDQVYSQCLIKPAITEWPKECI